MRLSELRILTMGSGAKEFSFVRFSSIFSNKWKKCEKTKRRRCENSVRMSSLSRKIEGEIPIAKKGPWVFEVLESIVSLVRSDRAIRLHEYVHQKHSELGPIFRDRIGPVELIFLNSPDDFRKIFRLEGPTPMHFLPEAWHLYNELRNRSRGLLFMDGDEWLQFRRIMNKVMLIPNPKFIMVPRCHEAATDLVEEWKRFADESKVIEGLETRLYRWSIEVMLATLVGSSWKAYKPRVDEETMKLAKNLHRIFSLSAKLSLIPVKYAIKFNLPVWREFCQVADEAFSSVHSMVPAILNLQGDGLLDLMSKEGVTKERDLTRIVTDLVIAAGDTTAFTMQWLLLNLARNPRVQDKLYERVKNLDENEVISDNYVKSIFKESLRLYPTAPFLTRFLPEDAIIAGHSVPKGDLMIMSLYSSGRDPQNFPDPDEFYPERWMRNEAGSYEKVINPHGSLPFALGARSCIGRKLAEIQIILTLCQIVKNFKIDCQNENEIEMILHLIAVPSKSIKLKFRKR